MQSPKRPARLAWAQAICRPLPPVLSQRVRAIIYPWNIAYRDSFDFIVRSQTGSLVKGNTGDFPAYPVAVHGYNVLRTLAIALAQCSDGDTIIEIGANTGTETLAFADIVGSTGKVFAFEPLSSNLQRLAENVRLNQASNISVLPLALSDRCGTATFSVPTDANSGIGHLKGDGDAAGAIEVTVKTLDDLAPQLDAAKLIAMDVEGAEILVLRGARNYVQRHRPLIILEADRRLLDRLSFSLADLYREVTGLGYEPYEIARFGLKRLHASAPFPDKSDWLCIPAERREAVNGIQASLRKCLLLPCVSGMNPMMAVSRRRQSARAVA